jgi:hypothetical protein
MTPSEYEQYVEKLVREMNLGPQARVLRNQKYTGVRQPGLYEVDIAIEIDFENRLKVLIIVECKNLGRRVDRPALQKMIQTRDAIAAHKAAIASPRGFSREAIDVARANGVALWVLSEAVWTTVHGMSNNPQWTGAYRRRKALLGELGFAFEPPQGQEAFISAQAAVETAGGSLQHSCLRGSGAGEGANELGVDARLASSEIVDVCARLLGMEAPQFEAQELF